MQALLLGPIKDKEAMLNSFMNKKTTAPSVPESSGGVVVLVCIKEDNPAIIFQFMYTEVAKN